MSILVMMAVKDVKIGAYMQPMAVPHSGTAIRAFEDAARPGQDSDISRHPGDFELWLIGTFNNETGVLSTPETGPVFIQKGNQNEADTTATRKQK